MVSFNIIIILFIYYFRHCHADTSLCEISSHCSNETEQYSFIQLLMKENYILNDDSIVWTVWFWLVEYQAWILSILGSSVVGLSGIFPLLVIPIEEGANLKTGAAASTLRVLLSFAVGGLLGDVFLHLLPEAWAADRPLNTTPLAPGTRPPRPSMTAGLWVLAGILLFTVLEMACPDPEEHEEEEEEESEEVDSASAETHINNNTPQYKSVGNGSKKHVSNESKIYSNGPILNGSATYTNGNTNSKYYSGYPNGMIAPKNSTAKIEKNGLTKCNGHNENGNGMNGFTEHLNGVNGTKSNGTTSSGMNGTSCKGTNGTNGQNGSSLNGAARRSSKTSGGKPAPPVKHVAGYLNLLANSIDNFMHGLAVGGGFLVSFKMGALTTLAILIHEVPHEIGDFAILLRAGFSRWDAARAQLYTAGSGLLGALTAVACSSSTVESRTSWVVPFTAGGFLHIALVTVLPELLAERDRWESAKQLAGLLTGMFIMAVLTACFE